MFAVAGIAGGAIACSTGPTTDNSAPILVFAEPQDGDTVSGTVNITVQAVDDDLVVSVLIQADGDTLTVDPSSPYQAVWNTGALVDGSSHQLRAVARDPAGNTGTQQINVVVRRTPPN